MQQFVKCFRRAFFFITIRLCQDLYIFCQELNGMRLAMPRRGNEKNNLSRLFKDASQCIHRPILKEEIAKTEFGFFLDTKKIVINFAFICNVQFAFRRRHFGFCKESRKNHFGLGIETWQRGTQLGLHCLVCARHFLTNCRLVSKHRERHRFDIALVQQRILAWPFERHFN